MRPSARLLVLDQSKRLLLFRFVHQSGPLAGQDFWATPGGGLENEETFEQAAIRELKEETGLLVNSIGPAIFQREFVLQLPDGEFVVADERFFVVEPLHNAINRDGWTAEEINVMTEHRWWPQNEIASTTETVWPVNLILILKSIMETSKSP